MFKATGVETGLQLVRQNDHRIILKGIADTMKIVYGCDPMRIGAVYCISHAQKHKDIRCVNGIVGSIFWSG